MKHSESLNELASALAKAQGEMRAPPKDKTAKVRMKNGGEYSYAYSDLLTVIESSKAVLSKNGLSISQGMQSEEDAFRLVTLLMHSSGQFLSYECPLPKGLPPQELGAHLTYYRRYSLCAVLGIASEDDDDANRTTDNTSHSISNVTKQAAYSEPPETNGREPDLVPTAFAPQCCGVTMKVSQYNNGDHFYCPKCKKKVPRAA